MATKSKWLVQILILSGGLNLALLATFFYFLIRDNPLHFSFPPVVEKIEKHAPPSLLPKLTAATYEQLLQLLSDKRIVEEKYKVRDFALGTLATYHDFDVTRALKRGKLSQIKWVFGENSFSLFPGLADEDFRHLQLFAMQERWPFTTQALFRAIAEGKADLSLQVFFCHSPEFLVFETLFARTHVPLQKGVLLKMALEGGWDKLQAFYEEQEAGCDLGDARRQKLLVDYLEAGSKTAAYVLLLTDPSFALNDLDDRRVCILMSLLTTKTSEAQLYVQKIVELPRSEAVRNQAMKTLSSYLGDEVAGRFVVKPGKGVGEPGKGVGEPGIGELRPVFRERAPASPPPQLHIIQPGESLWLISKKYQVPVEALMQANQLQSPVIRPGATLKIPH